MEEFEPKLKKKVFNRQFFSKYVYVLVIGLVLLLGVSYSLTFFIQNKTVAAGILTTGSLTVSFTDRNINASGLSVPTNDKEGLKEFTKSLTIQNTSNIDGIVNLTLSRTSGLALTDMRYAIVVNGAIQEIADVPSDGKILTTAIMGGSPSGETINVELRLWPKNSYAGNVTTFVGEIGASISYLGESAASLSSPTGKYVKFNCSGSNCETWQIVKVENDRLVLTRTSDYSGATNRTNSGKYQPASFNPALTFNDDSMITSLSTDGLNVYLSRTVQISGGSGTQQDPYTLINNIISEKDKKVLAVITYKDGNTTLGTQNVYYGEINYISYLSNNSSSSGWRYNNDVYELGDTVSFTTDVILNKIYASNVSYTDTNTNFNCSDLQCAIKELNDGIDDIIG